MAALFAEDALVGTRWGWTTGREGARRTYRAAQGAIRLRAYTFAARDSVGYVAGAYRFAEEASGADAGKFVMTLRLAPDGRLLITSHLDHGNDRPRPRPAAADGGRR